MYYVGLDIHQRSTSVEILDCNGKLVKRAEWKLSWPRLADQLKKAGKRDVASIDIFGTGVCDDGNHM